MATIKITDDCGDGTLHCPGCGGYNLHHEKVTHFNCGIRTVVDDNKATTVDTYKVEEEKHGYRGNAIRILFSCEMCTGVHPKEDDMYSLLIAQHKGTTYMQWEF